jgi:hypothetical protein
MPQVSLQYTRSQRHPLKSTLQCSTASSHKMTLSHPFLEGSTDEAVIKVPQPWFWGGPSPKIGCSTQPELSSVALRYCKLKSLGLPSYLTQLLLKPLPTLVLSPEYNFLVAPAVALSHHERWVNSECILGYSILCLDFPVKSVVLATEKQQMSK